jgi:hypothetical protein
MRLAEIRQIAKDNGARNLTIHRLCAELLNAHAVNDRMAGEIADLMHEVAELRGDAPYQVNDSDVLPSATAPSVSPRCSGCDATAVEFEGSLTCRCF